MTSLASRPVSPTNTRPQRGAQAAKTDKLPPANGRSPPGGAAEGGSKLIKTKSATTLVKVMKATKALKKTAAQGRADDGDEEFAANMRMLNPTKKMPQKNWAALEKAGWNPHSVELLGMVDKETLSNLTRTFADEGAGFGRSVSSESNEEHNTANTNKQGDGKSVAGVWTNEPEEEDPEKEATRKLLEEIPDDGSNFFDRRRKDPAEVRQHGKSASRRVSISASVEEDNAETTARAESPLGPKGVVLLQSRGETQTPTRALPTAIDQSPETEDGRASASAQYRLRRKSTSSILRTASDEDKHSPNTERARVMGRSLSTESMSSAVATHVASQGIRSLLKGISQNGDELKGFLQLRSSLSSSAALQKVYCELSARRFEVHGSANMSSALHKLDLRTLSVTLRQPPQPAGSGLGEQTKKPVGLESVILEVASGKEVVLLQAEDGVEAKMWAEALKRGAKEAAAVSPSALAHRKSRSPTRLKPLKPE